MKKKFLVVLLSLLSVACVGGAVACKAPSTNNVEINVELYQSEITLKVGETFKLTTTDGKAYNTYVSDNPQVCSVTNTGVLTAKSVGTAKISVTTGAGILTCEVKVDAGDIGKIPYYIELSSAEKLFVGNEQVITASVYQEGQIATGTVSWMVIGENVSYETDGNDLYLKGISKGFCTVQAKIGDFETSCKVKVYDETCILETPNVVFTEYSVYWEAVPNAIEYNVSWDRGASWTITKETSLMITNTVNPLNVIVVAVASAESEYVDSEYSLREYEIPLADLKESAQQTSTIEESIDGLVLTAKSGELLFDVYGNDGALFNNEGNKSLFEGTAIVLEVKAQQATEITFVTESVNGLKTYSSFMVGSDYESIGYLMNGYAYKCYVIADNSVEIKNICLQYKPNEFAYTSVYLNMVEAVKDLTNVENSAYIQNNLKHLCDVEYDLILAELDEDFLSSFDDGANPRFIDEKYDIEKLKERNIDSGSVDFTSDVAYLDYQQRTSLLIGGINGVVNFIYGNVLPEEEPDYEYYQWRIWSSQRMEQNAWISGVSIVLNQGWNTVELSWSNLIFGNKNIYIEGFSRNNACIALGSLVGKNTELDVAFLDKTVKTTDFVTDGATLSITTNSAYIDPLSENKTALIVTGPANANYSNISYNALLPENDPGYDFYEWRIWCYKATDKVLIGPKGYVPLKEGWNTVRFNSWAELKNNNEAFNRIYNDEAFYANYIWYAFGNLTGKYVESDVQFIGKQANAEDFSIDGGTMSLTTDTQYVDAENGNSTGLIVTSSTNYVDVIYHDLLPQAMPNYDYYEWRIWCYQASSNVSIGTTNRNLEQGWNTIRLTWDELQNGVRVWSHIYNNNMFAGGIVVYSIGNLTGKYDESRNKLRFLGLAYDLDALAEKNGLDKGNGDIMLTTDEQYLDEGFAQSLLVNGSSCIVNFIYSPILPKENPGYDYYEWRIWSSKAISSNAWVCGQSVSLNQGWNTVRLTWAQISSASNIYIEGFNSNKNCIALGSLTGYYSD